MTKNKDGSRRTKALDDENRMTISIIDSVYKNDVAEVSSSLKRDWRKVNSVEEKTGMSLLHIATALGNLTMADFLIRQRGIRLEVRDKLNRDPLDLAILVGHPGIIDLLFKKRQGISRYRREHPPERPGDVIPFKPR